MTGWSHTGFRGGQANWDRRDYNPPNFRGPAIPTLIDDPQPEAPPAGETLIPITVDAPTDRRILALHLVAVFSLGVGISLSYTLPFLAQKRFGAGEWQSWVLTSAVPISQFLTVYWNHLYARMPISRYLTLITLCACAPIALIAATTTIEPILILFVVAAWAGAGGGAAVSPINADVLRACYTPKMRGRIFGLLMTAQFLGVMIGGQAAGKWSDLNPDGYRMFLPIIAGILALGLFSYRMITQTPVFKARSLPIVTNGTRWWTPLRDMTTILREDKRFAAYETAFMSYGIGWMICTALLPLIGKGRLALSNSEYSIAVIVVYQVVSILMLPLMGRVADRAGPVKLAAVSFLWLTIFPIGLIFTTSGDTLRIFSALYAMGMTGVHLTWTLGPVAFAPEPSKAAQYLAIHGTLVGVRGVVAQGIGVALYAITGEFWVPLVIAAAGFLWAAHRMRRLGEEMRADTSAAAA